MEQDLHHDQARWRPEGLGTWAFSFLFESVIFFFFFTVYGSCVWLNRKCRKGKFWVFFFLPIFLTPVDARIALLQTQTCL